MLKPVDKADLLSTINRIKEQSQQTNFNNKVDLLLNNLNNKNRIKLNTREGYILIDPNEIIFCRADGSYTEIHQTTSSTEVSTFNLGKIADYLTAKNFFRISRSAIINLNFLKEVNRKKKTCTLLFDGKEMVFDIPKKQIKDLENYS
ncbi:MAG: LytTR family transcriptional regulator [Bacteroidales bacterium]|nr:LytTR family transcriptional regulator [Bacteroidales bacterium]MCF8403259.1 LytTR family transcriptional regulator [Bacteroidales bacterium]